MSSGRKSIKQNTRERVISSDWNRMQSFAAGYANEAMREQMLAPVDVNRYIGSTFASAVTGSNATDVVLPAAPDFGGVLNGLMVIVPAGQTYVTVTSGMLLVVDPEGYSGSSDSTPLSPDDGPGPARLVYSSGISATGVLNWAPNAGPGVRIDVIECQRTQIVAETDNRDIYTPSTGLFSALPVTKVTEGELTFRVRQGANSGGLPAPALGWVPLAVISAPAGATSLDACTIWDVRPLLSDRAAPYANIVGQNRITFSEGFVIGNYLSTGQLEARGVVEASHNGWKVGGRLQGSGFYSDLLDANHLSPTYSPGIYAPYYVVALLPSGYVRWVRYLSAVPSGAPGRIPSSFRGILALTTSATTAQVPTVYGMYSAPADVVVLVQGHCDYSGDPVSCSGDGTSAYYGASGFGSMTVTSSPPSSFGVVTITASSFPIAKGVIVQARANLSASTSMQAVVSWRVGYGNASSTPAIVLATGAAYPSNADVVNPSIYTPPVVLPFSSSNLNPVLVFDVNATGNPNTSAFSVTMDYEILGYVF